MQSRTKVSNEKSKQKQALKGFDQFYYCMLDFDKHHSEKNSFNIVLKQYCGSLAVRFLRDPTHHMELTVWIWM